MTVEQLRQVLRNLPPEAEVLLANTSTPTSVGFTSASRVSLMQVCRVIDADDAAVQFVKPDPRDRESGRRGSPAAVLGAMSGLRE